MRPGVVPGALGPAAPRRMSEAAAADASPAPGSRQFPVGRHDRAAEALIPGSKDSKDPEEEAEERHHPLNAVAENFSSSSESAAASSALAAEKPRQKPSVPEATLEVPSSAGAGDDGEAMAARMKMNIPITVVSESDLPYMGQITLERRSRRGRKPKKTDICHLVSKNYGIEVERLRIPLDCSGVNPSKTSRMLISHPNGMPCPVRRKLAPNDPHSRPEVQREPLNLCLKDLSTNVRKERLPDGRFPGDELAAKPLLSFEAIQKSIEAARLLHIGAFPPSSCSSVICSCSPDNPQDSRTAVGGGDVTICKFKFVGGSKPSLERKRVLSIDKSGNLLVQKKWNELGKLSKLDSLKGVAAASAPNGRKRKPTLRESIERTYQNKGVLIQTQRLECPQGSTFCKFRQLRKFTRYLFRSWKDYLPKVPLDPVK